MPCAGQAHACLAHVCVAGGGENGAATMGVWRLLCHLNLQLPSTRDFTPWAIPRMNEHIQINTRSSSVHKDKEWPKPKWPPLTSG